MAELRTFTVPALVTGTAAQVDLANQMIDAWRTDGIFQIATSRAQQELTAGAFDALAYFHEPAFVTTVRPLLDPTSTENIHYGTHFTNMFMRCYPDRITTRRILAEDRLALLPRMRAARQAA